MAGTGSQAPENGTLLKKEWRLPKQVHISGTSYVLEEHLGEGGFGRVYGGKRLIDGKPVAVKYVAFGRVSAWSEVDGVAIPQEVELLCRVQGVPGVVELLDYSEVKVTGFEGFALVMEKFADSTDVFDFITRHQDMDEDLVRRIFKQIVQTVIDCCERGVVHLDVKDENIILDRQSLTVKLIDFGAAMELEEGEYTVYDGTQVYAPPEWFLERRFDGKALTVWSLGVLLFNLKNGDVPFETKTQTCEGLVHWRHAASEECMDLVDGCLRRNPGERIPLEAILGHNFFQ